MAMVVHPMVTDSISPLHPIHTQNSYSLYYFTYPNRQHVQWIEIQYYPRMLFISLLSVFNSFLACIEHVLYNSAIYCTDLPDDPIFIIGHPRTGTTLLHNLLSSDTQHFFYATTFCVGFPSCFLWFESSGKQVLAPGLSMTMSITSKPTTTHSVLLSYHCDLYPWHYYTLTIITMVVSCVCLVRLTPS